VNQKVGVIYLVTDHQVDILRNVYWNLEQINGRKVYACDTFFWQRVGCLPDNFHCLKLAANKGNLMVLSGFKGIPGG
jgi:hypothetical protein